MANTFRHKAYYIVENERRCVFFYSKKDALRQYKIWEHEEEYFSKGLKFREILLDDSQYQDVSDKRNQARRDVNICFNNLPYTPNLIRHNIIKNGVSCSIDSMTETTDNELKVLQIIIDKRVKKFRELHPDLPIKVNLNGKTLTYIK